MYYVYVLKSKKDNKWYTGSTGDLRKRFKEHSEGKVFSTKNRGPFELIYYESCLNETDARMREKYLKSGPGKLYLKKRLKRFLSLTGFTLIELMIVLGVIVILSIISARSLIGSGAKSTLNNQTQITVKQLNNAAAKAISQDGGYQWWMRFDNPVGGANDVMYLCYGTSYTAPSTSCATEGVGAAESQRYTLNNRVQFTDPVSGTSKNVVFNKATGLPTATVNVTLGLVSVSGSNTITVNTNGRIDY